MLAAEAAGRSATAPVCPSDLGGGQTQDHTAGSTEGNSHEKGGNGQRGSPGTSTATGTHTTVFHSDTIRIVQVGAGVEGTQEVGFETRKYLGPLRGIHPPPKWHRLSSKIRCELRSDPTLELVESYLGGRLSPITPGASGPQEPVDLAKGACRVEGVIVKQNLAPSGDASARRIRAAAEGKAPGSKVFRRAQCKC